LGLGSFNKNLFSSFIMADETFSSDLDQE